MVLPVTFAARCVVAYEQRRGTYAPGKAFDLAQFTSDELTGLYLSTLGRFINRKHVSVVERVAILELIGPAGAELWARVHGEHVGDSLGVRR